MTRIAHLSDLHLLEEQHTQRPFLSRARLTLLSAGRPLHAARRYQQVLRALRAALRWGAHHIVITGDLTEDGTPEQFETVAKVLEQSGVSPSKITLVGGNHDGYTHPDGFARALQGPLRAYAATSQDGAVADLGSAHIVALCTGREQNFLRAAGRLGAEQVRHLRTVARQSLLQGAALLIALHHSPLPLSSSITHWVSGLQGHSPLAQLLWQQEHVHALHGHIHAHRTTRLAPGRAPQVHSVAAVVDHPLPLRLYHAHQGQLYPVALEPQRESQRLLESVLPAPSIAGV